MDEKDAGSFTLGFLIGALAGVAIGFLFAPKPGRETRTLLRETAGHGLNRARDAAAEVTRTVRDRIGRTEE